jgi:predicted dehydrogenase
VGRKQSGVGPARRSPAPVVLVGCGRVVELGHVPALDASAQFAVRGLVDPSADRRDEVARLLGLPPGVEGGDSLTESMAEGAVVVVACPSQVRLDVLEVALPAARVVVVEKPLASGADEAAQVLAAARAAGTHLVPVHNWRYDPSMRALRALARDGALGPLTSLRYVHHMTAPFPGAWPQRPLWRADAGGGCLSDLGYHAAYVFEEITGRPLRDGACTGQRSSAGVLDQARARWWAGPDVACDVDVSWSARAARFEVHVTGTVGDAVLTGDGRLVVSDVAGRRDLDHPAGFPVAYRAFYRDLGRRLRHAPDYHDAGTAVQVSQLLDRTLSGARPPEGGEQG